MYGIKFRDDKFTEAKSHVSDGAKNLFVTEIFPDMRIFGRKVQVASVCDLCKFFRLLINVGNLVSGVFFGFFFSI